MTLDNLILWLGFVSMFAIMLYGASKSVPQKKYIKTLNRSGYPKYVRVNRYA